MIAIIDYGMGNLRSVQKALEKGGAQTVITDQADVILKADKVVLPGVGAIRPAMKKLNQLNIVPVIHQVIESNKPFLGICLGLQLLFEKSFEDGESTALGLMWTLVWPWIAGLVVGWCLAAWVCLFKR